MRFKLSLLLLFLSSSLLWAQPGFWQPWGKDSDLAQPPQVAPPPVSKHSILAWGAEQIILFHQNVISPVDGPRSHFRPTSSRYMLLAIRRHGFFKGFAMGCDRLLRENDDPWVYPTVNIDGKLYKWDPPPP